MTADAGRIAVSGTPDTVPSMTSSSHPDSGGILASGNGRFRKNARLAEYALAMSSTSRRSRQLRRSKSWSALGLSLSVPRGCRGVNADDDDVQPPVDETLVYNTLRVLFRCMTALGACFVRRPEPPLIARRVHVTVKTGICGRRPTVNRSLMLSVVVSILLTANFARLLSCLQVGVADQSFHDVS